MNTPSLQVVGGLASCSSEHESAYLPLDATDGRRRHKRMPPHAYATGGGPSASASAMSMAAVQLQLLLLRAEVPNHLVLATQSDRDLAILAQSYGVELPQHLAHLPTLPAPKKPEEMEAAALAWDAASAELEGKSALQDRPPRKTRLHISQFDQHTAHSKSQPVEARPPAIRAAPPLAEDPFSSREYLLQGTASKERAPSNQRPRKTGGKKGAAAAPAPASAVEATPAPRSALAAAAPPPGEDPIRGTASKERAPSNRRARKTGGKK